MKRRIIAIVVLCVLILSLGACPGQISTPVSSSFSILFIDVGQGDSALVECDGHYMLIDAGNETAGDKVYAVLEERYLQHLDILVLSHLHADHIGGFKKALTYATSIGKTISNSDYKDSDIFKEVEHSLELNKTKIQIPHVGDIFNLGSAKVEVIDSAAELPNDSLVLLITYGENRFLFTGDIGEKTQTRIAEKYKNETYEIDIIKMPHHGANITDDFIKTFKPVYAVISVGENNGDGHPYQNTLDTLINNNVKLLRTDTDGNILVKSNGAEISITTNK